MNEITNYLNQLKKEQLLRHLRFPFFIILMIILGVKFNLFLVGASVPLIIIGIYTIGHKQRVYRFIKSMHRINNTDNFKDTFDTLFYDTQDTYDRDRKALNSRRNTRNNRVLKSFDHENLKLELEALRHIKKLLEDYKPEKQEKDQYDDFFEGYSNSDDYDSFQ